MEEVAANTDESYDSFEDQNYDERPTERWAPLGASVSPAPSTIENGGVMLTESEQLRQLEEQQEQLNSYLQALTTHFAQVQFRLKQTVNAPPEEKEVLLKELEQLAFQGVPDVVGCMLPVGCDNDDDMNDNERGIKINEQREKQKELINQLKMQLEDLELYAYKNGEAGLPTSQMMEKQRILIDQLKNKLDLKLENFDHLSSDQLKEIVDNAIGQIVNPAKVKGKLVDQLKTQITDLERFIQFLQGEATSPGPLGKERCTCSVHSKTFSSVDMKDSAQSSNHKRGLSDNATTENLRQTTLTLMKKALALLQVFAITQLGCGTQEFQKNLLKRTTKGNHWGDLRAQLEISINKVLKVAAEEEILIPNSSDFDSESDEDPLPQSSPAVTQAVRRELAMSIRDLMQHGLVELGQSNSLVTWGCFPNRSSGTTKLMHAWDLLLKFYEMKHGKEYNESPARKLSQSFHLDIVGGKPITAKQTLLGAIDTIIQSHTPLKRSEDSHFKAFICLALNEKKLVTWLKLLFRTQFLVDYYYQDWSYVARTGFDDTLKSLEPLNSINFKLPVDIAVRPFSKIKDAF
ncbi:Hypothetical predicted protein [Octopus vulgaris]|uniref:Uncharacterized protein n=2 Tax=Octopus TaxID=6643 RepID=A0AA36BHG2_OCTVU|nr:RUN domain-containing protein 1 [Octopus sinensis]CAI9733691.1 Hypothetical predicted protein [Octopus vulgaris]